MLENVYSSDQSWQVLYLVLCIWVLVIYSLKQKTTPFHKFLFSSNLLLLIPSQLFLKDGLVFLRAIPLPCFFFFKLIISPRLALTSLRWKNYFAFYYCCFSFEQMNIQTVSWFCTFSCLLFENSLTVIAFVKSICDSYTISQKQDVTSRNSHYILKKNLL